MEIHLVVRICLDYLGTLDAWASARVLCRDTRAIVRQQPYEFDVFGSRTFIVQNQCMACSKRVESPRWITYKALPVVHRRYTVTCRHYRCQVSALFSMLRDLASENIHVLKTPFQAEVDIAVPRSDGSTTPGRCVTHGLLHFNNAHHVMTWWTDIVHDYQKNIPWTHYHRHAPEFIFPDVWQ